MRVKDGISTSDGESFAKNHANRKRATPTADPRTTYIFFFEDFGSAECMEVLGDLEVWKVCGSWTDIGMLCVSFLFSSN